ncbi:MAG: sulfatase-like hydrolase/transferase, partial [Balneolales bacterium]
MKNNQKESIPSHGIARRVLLLLLFVCISTSIFAQSHTNIILIVSDDQGYNDIGAYGNEEIHTPNLDRLADEGVKGTNFYVTGPGCTPSRSGFLTGRYPQRNGLYDMIRNDWAP